MERKRSSYSKGPGGSKPYKSKPGGREDKPYRGKDSEGDARRPKFTGDKTRGDKRFGDDRKDKPFEKREGGRKPFDSSDRPKRSFDKNDDRPKRPYGKTDDRRKFDGDDRPKRSFDKSGSGYKDFKDLNKPNRSFDKKDEGDKPKRSFERGGERKKYDSTDRPKRSFDRNDDRPKRPYGKSEGEDRPKRSFDKRDDNKKFDSDRPKRPYGKTEGGDRPKRSFDKGDDRKKFDSDRPKRSTGGKSGSYKDFKDLNKPKLSFAEDFEKNNGRKKFGKKEESIDPDREVIKYKKYAELEDPKPTFNKAGSFRNPDNEATDKPKKSFDKKERKPFERKAVKKVDADKPVKKTDEDEFFEEHFAVDDENETAGEQKPMTLNKYIAHSGQCSRREAGEMVKQGKVKVNGELVLEPGYRMNENDLVTIAGKKLTPIRNNIYILLNKPKGYITTTDDPEGRDTVMDLVADSGVERLFPVGRLDRNTTGLILLTNDGDLAQKLAHPSYETEKVYQVTLDKQLTQKDFDKILEGIELEDGLTKVDALAYLENKKEVGLEIHSGKNRVVRRIFESLGYEVEKLDRVVYAGLTKKALPRGKWRILTSREVVLLKHFKS